MKQRGISLIEILISIAIVGGAITVFAILFSILKVNKTGSLYTLGYKIAQEEMEAIRALSLSELGTRTDSNFINILYNNGVIGAKGGALRISPTSPSLGIISLPYNNVGDLIVEANIKASSMVNKSGILFRARDLENYYFFYIKADRIALEKNVESVLSTIHESFQSFSPDTYYKLKIIASGSNISLYLNDNLIQTTSDDSLTQGYVSLATTNPLTDFDDVTLDSTTWNFEGLDEGELPISWKRIGINDLPNGSGKLTISEPYGSSSIKQVDITISWTERDSVKTINLSSLKSE